MTNYRWLRGMRGWEDRRSSRRALVIFWIALLAFWAWIGVWIIRVDVNIAVFWIPPAVSGLFLTWWAFRKMRIRLSLPLRDRSVAYRLLRAGLMFVVAGYWIVCLLGPFEAVREKLALTAVALTWLVATVLVLPTIVRMWTQPDGPWEPKVERRLEIANVNWLVRQTITKRSQRWRRVWVIYWYLFQVVWLVYVLGGFARRFQLIFFMMIWLNLGWSLIQLWRSERLQTTKNADEMAQALYGVNFAELGKLEQEEVQTTLREGSFTAERAADERENDQKLRANSTAFRILQWGLSGFALVYWGAWVLLPDWLGGRIDLRRVLNPGWWILWVTALVITLPRLIRMWTEPDEVGDPKVVAMEREA